MAPALGRPLSDLRGPYATVIIGSGYGASVCAARLSRAGLRVCVLERGRELQPGDFPRSATGFARASQVEHARGRVGDKDALFRFVLDEDCSAVMGCGLGGTSLINAGVAMRPDPATWDEPRWPAALRDDRRGLEAGFAQAEAMLRPAPYPELRSDGTCSPRLAKLDALEAAARAIGLGGSFSRVPLTIAFEDGQSAAGVAQPACELCGECLNGCNTGAKSTLLTTYLADAVQHGAELFTGIDVRWVERLGRGQGYNVFYDPTELMRDKFDAPPLHLRAGLVILGAGSIGSTEILLRSRELGLAVSPELGKRFSGNATTVAFGHRIGRDVFAVGGAKDGVVGPAIAGMINVRQGTPMVIQETSIPAALTLAVSALLRGSTAQTQCYAVTARDDSAGQLELEDGRVRIRWPGAGLQPVVGEIHERLAEATEALGGRLLMNPAWQHLPSHPTMTTHPLGGCAMAESGALGVVDHRGEVFAGSGQGTHHGLYVCDGSTLPGALGCNPLLTISALAERTVELLLRERGLSAHESTAPRLALAPRAGPAPVGLRFTERMRGTWSGAADGRISFVCSLVWEDLDALLADQTVEARSIGTLAAPGLSPQPLTVVDGRFRLLVPMPDGSQRMIHRLEVEDRDGNPFYVDGYKTIARTGGRGPWGDTTTLFIDVYEGRSAKGRHLGKGSVVVHLGDLVRQVSSMRGAGAAGVLASAWSCVRFVNSFTSSMARTYGPRLS